MLGLMLPSVYWVLCDNRVWPWDQAWYGEVSVELWFKLTHHFGRWIPSMIGAFGSKAPGVAFLGQFFVPIGKLLGSIESGILLSVIVAQVGTLSLVYKTGKRFAPASVLVPLAGILTVAAAPLFVALSHQYVAEPLQLFGVAYFYYLAACAETMRRESLMGHLLMATSVAMLAKVTSPLYCALPGCIALGSLLHKFRHRESAPSGRPLWKDPLIVAGAVLFALCVTWYVRNFGLVRDFVRLASSSEVALDYGSRGTFRSKLITWLHASQFSLGHPVILIGQAILLLAGISFGALRSRNNESPFSGRLNLLAMASLLHILAVLVLFSLNINEETRYLLPLLPAVATIVMWGLSWIRIPAISLTVMGLLLVQWLIVCGQALALTNRNPQLSYWLHPFDRNRGAMDEVSAVAQATSQPKFAGRINIVGVERPWLNANSLAFFAAKEQLKTKQRCYYTSLGYAAKDIESAWDRMNAMNSLYFISLEEAPAPETPDFLNQISIPALHRVQNDRAFVRQPFDSKLGIVIFRREPVITPY